MSEQRIQRLEQRLRWTETGLAACILGMVLFIGLGMMAPGDRVDEPAASDVGEQELKVRRLLVVDEKGQVVITLQASGEEEGPSIQVNDVHGTKRFWIGTKDDGESRLEHWDFQASDRDSVLRILSSIDDDGIAMSRFDDERGQSRIGIGTSSNNETEQMGFISCIDKDDRGRIWMGTTDDGMAEVIHSDANGVRRISDFTDGDSGRDPSEEEDASDFLGGRWYSNPYGTSRLWAGTDRGTTGISLYDWSEKARMAFFTRYSGRTQMKLWDGEGETVWSKTSEGEEGAKP